MFKLSLPESVDSGMGSYWSRAVPAEAGLAIMEGRICHFVVLLATVMSVSGKCVPFNLEGVEDLQAIMTSRSSRKGGVVLFLKDVLGKLSVGKDGERQES